jgi:hypothetical protein
MKKSIRENWREKMKKGIREGSRWPTRKKRKMVRGRKRINSC